MFREWNEVDSWRREKHSPTLYLLGSVPYLILISSNVLHPLMNFHNFSSNQYIICLEAERILWRVTCNSCDFDPLYFSSLIYVYMSVFISIYMCIHLYVYVSCVCVLKSVYVPAKSLNSQKYSSVLSIRTFCDVGNVLCLHGLLSSH